MKLQKMQFEVGYIKVVTKRGKELQLRVLSFYGSLIWKIIEMKLV